MAGVLRRAGHQIVANADAADLLILNTCTVKDKTMRTFRRRLSRLSLPADGRAPRPVVISGCIPKAQPDAAFLKSYPLLGPDAVGRVSEVVEDALRGVPSRILYSDQSHGRNRLPVLRRNPAVEILPIARGCRSACTFCQTRLARGRLISFPPEEILAQACRALAEGVSIFWVTGQDTGAYGHDTGIPLDELMRALLDLPGEFRVRLGMSSPQWIAERMEPIMAMLEHPKMFKFLHVPLQSGSDSVLKHMKRDGGVEEFRKIHAAFRERFPKGSFVTDLIVGYPTETDSDFEATLELVRELRIGLINVSKFSPRPGTAAAKLTMLPHEVIKQRAARLLDEARKISRETLSGLVGSNCEVIVEQTATNGKYCIGRTTEYRPVHVDGASQPGERFKVTITASTEFHLSGRRYLK